MSTVNIKNLVLNATNIIDAKYPSLQKTLDLEELSRAYEILRGSESVSQNELGRIYRRVASILNREADNLLDECHTTEVER